MIQTEHASHPKSLAVTAQQIVGIPIVAVSLATWRRLDAGGRCPRGFMLGGRKLWRTADLEAWTAAGFPDRAEFERRTKEAGHG